MILVRETTVWDGNYSNHTYLLSDDMYKMYGYFKAGTKEFKMFSKPIGFDKRYRTFKVLQKNLKMKEVK
jgi:hypothetical protein